MYGFDFMQAKDGEPVETKVIENLRTHVLINNRSGRNAPLPVQTITSSLETA